MNVCANSRHMKSRSRASERRLCLATQGTQRHCHCQLSLPFRTLLSSPTSTMTTKEATVYILDLGRSMGEKRNGRSQTNLKWALEYVWDKITTTVSMHLITDGIVLKRGRLRQAERRRSWVSLVIGQMVSHGAPSVVVLRA